jgi:hypothetical protein
MKTTLEGLGAFQTLILAGVMIRKDLVDVKAAGQVLAGDYSNQ